MTSFSGSLSVKASSGIDQTSFDHPDNSYAVSVSPSLSLSLSSSQGDAWSLSATLVSDTEVINAGQITATTPSVKVSAVKDKDNSFLLSKVADPLDLVAFNVTADDGMKDKGAVRIESSAFGPSVTFQLDDATGVGLAASMGVGPATVGTVVVPSLPTSAGGRVTTKLSGYAQVGLGIADLTVAAGRDSAQSTDGLGYGAKVTAKPVEIAEVSASYVSKQKNFGDATTLGAGAKVTLAPIEASLDYSTTSKTSAPGTKVADSIKASVSYKAAPVEVSASYATEHGKDTDHTNPKNTISGSLKFGLIPDVASVTFDVTSESDADRELSAFTESTTFETVTAYVKDGALGTDVSKAVDHTVETGDAWNVKGDRLVIQSAGHMKVGAGVEYKLSPVLTVKPSLAYHSWSDLRYRTETDNNFDGDFDDPSEQGSWFTSAGGSITALELGLTASYAVSNSVSLEAGLSQTGYSFTSAGPAPSSAAKRSASVTVKVAF